MSAQNFEFGRGKVFIALEEDGFTNPAYRYLGQTPGFEITMTPERIDLKSSDGPSRETIASVVIENEATGTMACNNVSQENLALFFIGSNETINQASGALSVQIANIKQGFSYFLGEGLTDLNSKRFVTSVAISGAVAGTDYDIDEALGLISFKRGSTAIAEGSTKTVTGSITAKDWTRTKSSDKGEVRCRLKFVADNANGENRLLILPLVSLAPSGAYQPQSEDAFVSLDFDFTILKSGLERIVIDGAPVNP
jgi:hypothetical protein